MLILLSASVRFAPVLEWPRTTGEIYRSTLEDTGELYLFNARFDGACSLFVQEHPLNTYVHRRENLETNDGSGLWPTLFEDDFRVVCRKAIEQHCRVTL